MEDNKMKEHKRKVFEKENKKVSIHHMIPKSRSGVSFGKNLKFVPVGYHRAYHHLFENLTPDEVRLYMDEVWLSSGQFIQPLVWLKHHHKRPQK